MPAAALAECAPGVVYGTGPGFAHLFALPMGGMTFLSVQFSFLATMQRALQGGRRQCGEPGLKITSQLLRTRPLLPVRYDRRIVQAEAAGGF